MKLKICGLKHPDNIIKVAELKPDYMGFIFYDGSKRFVGEHFLMPEISLDIKKVGVFVNSTAATIISAINKYKLDAIQLHGEESPTFCEVFSHLTEVIKAFGVDETFDMESLTAYENCCHYFLFDSKTESRGGSGKQFDWNKLNDYKLKTPFFLSGGIGLEEIQEIPNFKFQIHGVDVNSRFEFEPGIKDVIKLERFKLKLKDELPGK